MDEPNARWVIVMRPEKASIWLPPGIDYTRMIEVTKLGEEYAVFYDPENFITHRCADYRRAALADKGLS